MNITKDDVGKKVFSVIHGWGEIKGVYPDKDNYPVVVIFSDLAYLWEGYTYDGRNYPKDNRHPELRWQEVDITDPPKPEPERTAPITEKEFDRMHTTIKLLGGLGYIDTFNALKIKIFGKEK